MEQILAFPYRDTSTEHHKQVRYTDWYKYDHRVNRIGGTLAVILWVVGLALAFTDFQYLSLSNLALSVLVTFGFVVVELAFYFIGWRIYDEIPDMIDWLGGN